MQRSLDLSKHQAYMKEQVGVKDDKPVILVFHGGFGSLNAVYKQVTSYGYCRSQSRR